MKKNLKDFFHLLTCSKARFLKVQIGHEVKLSPYGTYSVHQKAQVMFSDGVWLAHHHHIIAGEGAVIFLGKNVRIGESVRIVAEAGARISIEAGCFFNHNVSIVAHSKIEIGENSIVGPYSYLSDHNHRIALGTIIKEQEYDFEPIIVGSDTWMGVGSTLLKGAKIGDGAVIAARAVVNKEVPNNEVWGGIPAKRIGERH